MMVDNGRNGERDRYFIIIKLVIFICIYMIICQVAEKSRLKSGRYDSQVRESNLGCPICPHPIVQVEELKEAQKRLFNVHHLKNK